MSSTVEYWAQKNIIYVRHKGTVTLEDRVKIMLEIEALQLQDRRILADVRDLSDLVTNAQTKEIVASTKERRFGFKKIAVLHHEHFNPYMIMASLGVVEGLDIEDFTSLKDAEDWLQA